MRQRCIRDIDKLSRADAAFVRFLNAPRLLAPSEREIAALREIATKPLRTTKPRSSRRDLDDPPRRHMACHMNPDFEEGIAPSFQNPAMTSKPLEA